MNVRIAGVWIVLVICFLAGCRKGQVVPEGTKRFLAGKSALEKGDTATALKEFDAAIASEPAAYIFLERAKLKHTLGDDPGAIADCEEAIKLDPDHAADAKWYIAELKKPKAKQFQGEEAAPPSAGK
jgi:tetratricopeptide (TPR) repeat protein